MFSTENRPEEYFEVCIDLSPDETERLDAFAEAMKLDAKNAAENLMRLSLSMTPSPKVGQN